MTAVAEEITPVEELAVQRLRKYARITKTAEELAQKESLEVAAELVALYERMNWVAEMDELHPVSKRTVANRPADPRSFSRFTRWLVQVQGVELDSRYQYRLRTANELLGTYLAKAKEVPKTEAEVRPFAQLAKQGYGDRIPDIWAEVTAEGFWTATTVRQKISEFRKTWTPGQKRSATATEKASMRQSRAMSALEDLYALDPELAVKTVNLWAERHGLVDQDAAQ